MVNFSVFLIGELWKNVNLMEAVLFILLGNFGIPVKH